MGFTADIFTGKTVAVTGGTSGIGAATAVRFAGLGAEVFALGLNAEGTHAPRHAGITCVELDMRERDAVERFFGARQRLDVLVNSAGISRHREEWESADFDAVIDVNLAAVFRASQASRPLLARSRGAVVNIASMYATFGAADRPAYAASKGGIVQLTKSMAVEYAGENIRVNAVAPGWIDTPLADGLFDNPQIADPIMARIPLARWGSSDEVADAIVFLSSPLARYVTGAVLPVDGGYLTV